MKIRHLPLHNVSPSEVGEIMKKNNIPFNDIKTVNWPEYPYSPDVKFRVAHTGDSILLEFRVKEEYVRAMAGHDNGPVWEDSCVEMFLTFNTGQYYNIECNCRGDVLLACGPERNNRTFANTSVVELIRRSPSISDTAPFDNRPAPEEWSMSLVIPVESFFADKITSLSGMVGAANFYKCGDMLPTPYFLSWCRISVPAPDFHRPDFFAEVEFE